MEKTSTVIEDRRKKIDRLKEIGINPYPAGFKYNLKTCEAVEKFGHIPKYLCKNELFQYTTTERIEIRSNLKFCTFVLRHRLRELAALHLGTNF